jgi:DNA invertase Pin-like site-specific DNA recombinase
MAAHQGKFVAYFRVSTDKQGKSGLGLEAQRKAVLDYLNGGRWSLVEEFVEVESGKHNERSHGGHGSLQTTQGQARYRQARPPVP